MDVPSVEIPKGVPIRMWLQYAGSIASILGLVISVYVLWREYVIEKDVTDLKVEEETWHKEHTGE